MCVFKDEHSLTHKHMPSFKKTFIKYWEIPTKWPYYSQFILWCVKMIGPLSREDKSQLKPKQTNQQTPNKQITRQANQNLLPEMLGVRSYSVGRSQTIASMGDVQTWGWPGWHTGRRLTSGRGSVYPQAGDERRKISGPQTSTNEFWGTCLWTELLVAGKRTIGEI